MNLYTKMGQKTQANQRAQAPLQRPDSGDGRLEGVWLAFALETDEATAARRFRERFGCLPARTVCNHGLLLVGPVGGDGRPSPLRRAEAAGTGVSPERARQLLLQIEKEA